MPTRLEACILAGGLSSRMGRDKARLRLGRRTMLGHIRAVAKQLGIPVRTIRRDTVSRCGPLGGIYTALKTSRAELVIILACDMPFVSPAQFLERHDCRDIPSRANALFAREKNLASFPCVLRRERCLPVVSQQIAESKFSMQALAKALYAKMITPGRNDGKPLANINTPSDLEKARQRVRSSTLFRRSLSKPQAAAKITPC